MLLSGTSIGNHQNISFTDTLTIEKLTQDSLILKRGELLLKYARNNEALNQKTIPAAVLTPAKKLLSVRGELVIGQRCVPSKPKEILPIIGLWMRPENSCKNMMI